MLGALILGLAACGRPQTHAGGPAELDALIAFHAAENGLPVDLVRRVVRSESNFSPTARNGPYWGLMQLLPQTARTMGHRGPPEQLLDPDVNLRYGTRYLRGAWIVADRNPDRAVMWYRRGYYYEARRRGLLRETGLRP
ncbi:MAG: transglycosylase SLT domain-containing protein [Gemmobacter sp.]